MLFLKPRVMDRTQGSGTTVLLADVSTSMDMHALMAIDQAAPHFRRDMPGLRVFSFHSGLVEVADPRKTSWAEPRRGNGGTFLAPALRGVSALNPSKTIVLSDGGMSDKSAALAMADRMSGSIDAYFCRGDAEWEDIGFMQQLARRGRGRFMQYQRGRTNMLHELRESIAVTRQRVIHYHNLPDKHVHHGRP